MKKIFLLRHGSTTLIDRYVGVSDVELSENGREEILAQASYVAQHSFPIIFCSPLRRCRQTREALGLHRDVIYDERIAEINFGKWEGKTFSEIACSSPDLVEEWRCAGSSFCFPGGEKLADFYERINDFASSVHAAEAGKILIISHGGVIRHLICRFLNLSFDSYLYFKVECGKFTILDLHSDGGILTGLNNGVIRV